MVLRTLPLWAALAVYVNGKFDCAHYKTPSGKAANFCEKEACTECQKSSYPPQCMEDKYVSSGQCEQLSGMPLDACRVVVGVKPGHTLWCQLEACPYTMAFHCITDESCDLANIIVKEFPVCKVAGSNPADKCFAFSDSQSCQACTAVDANKCTAPITGQCYSSMEECSTAEKEAKKKTCFTFSDSQSCQSCSQVDNDQCTAPVAGQCYETKDACDKAEAEYKEKHKDDDKEGCWVMDSATNECVDCKEVTQNQCTSRSWTPCKKSKKDCMGDNAGSACFARSGWSGADRCARCPTAGSNNECRQFSSTPCYESLSKCREVYGEPINGKPTAAPTQAPPPTEAPPTQAPAPTQKTEKTESKQTEKTEDHKTEKYDPNGPCYAVNPWSKPWKCNQCQSVQAGQCTSLSWAPCFNTVEQCLNYARETITGDGCKRLCPDNTKQMQRPQFKGPNCYDSKYGKNFGPNWAPSGKTAVERFLKHPNDFFMFQKITQDSSPMLPDFWKLNAAGDMHKAATAVYENFVCALEYLQEANKKFDSPLDSTIDKMFNSGDETTDKIELAAFFAHKMKETGRFTKFDEATANAYCDPNSVQYPCVPGKSYHGRGAVQVSWNYNYGPLSEWIFGDKNVLLNDPDMVDPEGPMGFISAIWFWMTQREFTSGSPIAGMVSTHDAIVHWNSGKLNSAYTTKPADYDRYAGFGLSTNIINGGIECTGDNGGHRWRVAYFLAMLKNVGIDVQGIEDPNKCAQNAFCHSLWRGCTKFDTGSCVAQEGFCPGSKQFWEGNGPSCTFAK